MASGSVGYSGEVFPREGQDTAADKRFGILSATDECVYHSSSFADLRRGISARFETDPLYPIFESGEDGKRSTAEKAFWTQMKVFPLSLFARPSEWKQIVRGGAGRGY